MKDKQKKFLDRVVKLLVDETEVGNGWFNPPYYFPGSAAGRTSFISVFKHTLGLLKNTHYSGLETQLIYFEGYCKNNYGLSTIECIDVWEKYMTELNNKYFNYSLDHE